MRLRALRLQVETGDGTYETNIEFPDGLVIVRADNSMGKSTCFRAILVALGMEAMLTTKQSELPLTPAVLRELETETGKQSVIESSVFLEIENRLGQRITTFRQLRGERNQNLIGVYRGAALTDPGDYEFADYFVNRDGGATRSAGFHLTLARFLGWDLPQVPTFEGSDRPLYLQVLFPFFFVEQKRGWSSDVPVVPSQLRIRDPHKRSVEFLLNLDAYKNAVRRQELDSDIAKLQTEWSQSVRFALATAKQQNGQVQGLPDSPSVSWPPEIPPTFMLPVGDEWLSVSARLTSARKTLQELVEQEIPRVEEIASVAETELAEAESELNRAEYRLAELRETSRFEAAEIEAMKSRLGQIKSDLIENKDSRTLKEFGSLKFDVLNRGECPTCHQSIQDSLLPLAGGQMVMTLDQNIAFLDEQRKMIQGALSEAETAFETREQEVLSATNEVVENRNRVRSLKQTLVSDGRLPSAAAIEERIRLSQEIERLESAADTFGEMLDHLGNLAADYRNLKSDLNGLPRRNTSQEDRQKISQWTAIVHDQLSQYGFGSIGVGEIEISDESYRPVHEGFDLVSSISASDLIRTIWAYLIGMLELSRQYQVNHPGLLVFDEPRQQSTREVSFAGLLQRAAQSLDCEQQVVFFTSEDPKTLKSALDDHDFTLQDFGDDQKLLRRVES